jgi:hypothetical protein
MQSDRKHAVPAVVWSQRRDILYRMSVWVADGSLEPRCRPRRPLRHGHPPVAVAGLPFGDTPAAFSLVWACAVLARRATPCC